MKLNKSIVSLIREKFRPLSEIFSRKKKHLPRKATSDKQSLTPFLMLILSNRKIEYDWYHKACYTF